MSSAPALAGTAALAALLLGPGAVRQVHRNLLVPLTCSGPAAAATSCLSGILAASLACSGDLVTWAVAAPLLAFGLPAAIVDAHEQRLPDALTRPLLATTLLTVAVAAAATGDWPAGVRAILAAVVVTGGAVAVKGLRSSAVGWGDIKLMPSLGAALGWSHWSTLGMAAALWMLLIAISAAALGAVGRDSTVPYGPALLVGAAAALAAGP